MRNTSKKLKISISLTVALIALGGVSFIAPFSSAATTIPLGTSSSFAVLAGAGLSNAGQTTITGDVGSSPTTTYTNTGSVTRIGNIHLGDTVAATAQVDATAAYNNALGQSSTGAVVADLGGQTLMPGVYKSATALGLTGTLTLDAGGNANAVFLFQTGLGLTTTNASKVTVINGGSQCNVFWQIGTSAAIGTNSTMIGNVIANADITVATNATVSGRLLALHGAINTSSNLITAPTCGAPGVVIPPVVVVPIPTACPVFTTLPAITSTTNNSLTISWVASKTGSWEVMTHATSRLDSGTGPGGTAVVDGLATYSSNTQTVILFGGPNETGCRLTQAITGTTAGGPVLPPLPPIVIPTPTTPPVVPLPPVPPVQVPVPPTGAVKTGDGSLGKVIR
jgi:hypothetical protein